jgi:hypothetical protein
MSIAESTIISILKPTFPEEIITNMLMEYKHIKKSFFLGEYRPAELTGARFAECVLRLLEFINTGNYTPFGTQVNSENVINRISNNAALANTIRSFVPKLTRIILDVRNKRDVAHVGGEVSPNLSDSIFIVHSVDWILTEIVRHYHSCSINDASKIVTALNEIQIPIIDEISGFKKVLNSNLKTSDKSLVILYSEMPNSLSEEKLQKWVEYKNKTHFKAKILKPLHTSAYIHYENGLCTLTRKGALYVEKNINMSMSFI